QTMKNSIVFTGTIKHEGVKEQTDYLCLKNGKGEDDSEGVSLLRLLLYPKGVKLNRTSAGQTDANISFKVFARKLTDTDNAVQISFSSQDASPKTETSPRKRTNVAKSITLNIDFPTDTIVIKGNYEAISFKIEADTAGREVQFEHVIGADMPTLTLIESDVELVEIAEEKDEDVKSECQSEAKSEADETASTNVNIIEEGEIKDEKEEIKEKEEPMDEEKAEEEKEEGEEEEDEKKEEIEEEKDQENEEHENSMEEYDLVLEEDQEDVEDDANKSVEMEAEPVVKLTDEEKKALEEQRAEEKRLRREREDREAGLLEDETDFTADKFEPTKILCRRPPWRERAAPVDIKAWELFCDAVTTFESTTLDEYVDDWVVTVENLLPQLRNCFREAAAKGIPDAPDDLVENLPLLMSDWARFGLCLDRADAQPSPAKFLRVGMGIVEQIAGYSFEPRYGCALLEQGIAWDLMNVLTETTYSALQHDVLHVLHLLQCCRGVSLTAADVFFKFEKASVEKTEGEEKEDEEEKEKEEKGENEEEVKEKGEDEMASIYDRLALLATQMDETSCESTSLLDLALRVISRANLNAAAARLLAATRAVVVAAAAAAGADEEERVELSSALNSFLDRFHRNEGVLRGFGLEEEARKAYGVLTECDWTGVVSVLLSLTHDQTTNRAVGFTAAILEAQECVGLFALAESSLPLQRLLVKQLMMMERKEVKKKDNIRQSKLMDDDAFTYDETPSLDKRKESGKELASRIAHRLRVLQLVDELAECNKSLSFDSMDDPARLSVLHRLLRMSVTEEGESALCSIFSQCAFSLLTSIVTAVVEDKRWEAYAKDRKRVLCNDARSRPSFVYALELMKIVSAKADGAAFWTRNARHYQKMIKYQPLLPPTTSLHSWWDPFKDTVVASADLGSHIVVTAIRARLREYATKMDDGDPSAGAVALLRVMESLLMEERRTAAPRGAAARIETISYCLSDGIPKVIEDILKSSLEYRLSLFTLGTSIESGNGSELFKEFAERALRILSLLYSSSLDASGSVRGLSVNAVGYAVGLWTLTTGIMKTVPSLGETGASLRREVLVFLRVMGGFAYRGEKEELEGDWEGKSALTRMVRRVMDYGKDRMMCQPAALTLLCIVQEWCEEEEGGEGRKRFEEALKESTKAVGALLLNYAPYARQMALRVFERLDRTIGGEVYTALTKSIYSHFIAAFTCRPKRNKHCVDKEDVSVLSAKERHVALAKVFSSLTSSRRFVVALLQTLHDDAQASGRLSHILAVATYSSAKWKTHHECQEALVDVVARLADHSFYEEDTLGDMDELIEANDEEEEEEKEEEEEMEEMEQADEFLDETYGVAEEEEAEKKEGEKEEEKEKKHPDLPLRLCRVLVRMATSPVAAPPTAAAAIAALAKLHAHDSALAKDSVIRAWVDHKWKFPLVRGLLHAATTAAAKDEAKKEKVEDLLRSTIAHLNSVFGSCETEGRMATLLDVNGKEEMTIGSGENKCVLQPISSMIESMSEKERAEWMKAVEKAKETETAEPPPLAPRSHVIYKREENDPEMREEEMAKKLSLIISVTSSDYNDVELNPTLKVDIDKRRKPVKNAETRLRLAERADGYPVKRPDLSKPDRIEKAKDSAKKENAKGSPSTKAGSAEATKAAAARVAAIKSKPATAAAEKEKKEENIPNRIQPAVIPSRPAKRSAPTSVPRAGIKRRR
ncbi:hypothetical protein PRIPAC_84182, partial [Pristionchus pacificus]